MRFGDQIRERVEALKKQAAKFSSLTQQAPGTFGQAEAPSQVVEAEIQFGVTGTPRVQTERQPDGSTRVSCWQPEATGLIVEGETELRFTPRNLDPRFPSVTLTDLEAQAPGLATDAKTALEENRRRSRPKRVVVFP